MATIDELVQQIADPVLRDHIRQEADKLAKQKKFGSSLAGVGGL